MGKYASAYVDLMQDWVGKNEADGSHMDIVNIYNNRRPLARNYKVKKTDSWCATTVSAAAIELGYTDIMPLECSCGRLIEKCTKMGIWIEADDHIPKPGEWIFYDWDDNGVGDNKGWSDHVGIVEKTSGNTITVIEGNYGNAVKRRSIYVNGKFIRGYGVPKYDAENTVGAKGGNTVNIELNVLSKGSKGEQVKTLQRLLNAMGFDCGSVDGSFGPATDSAVKEYQKENKLTVDGSVGQATWNSLLK